ncbi:hypothetical protein Tco_0623603, partial [Tanacetum coccineum]
VKYRQSQEVLVDIPENRIKDINMVAEHGLSSKTLRAQVGAQIRARGPKPVGASRIMEDQVKD